MDFVWQRNLVYLPNRRIYLYEHTLKKVNAFIRSSINALQNGDFINFKAEFAPSLVTEVTDVSCKRNEVVVMFGNIMQQVLLSDVVSFRIFGGTLAFPKTLSMNEFHI